MLRKLFAQCFIYMAKFVQSLRKLSWARKRLSNKQTVCFGWVLESASTTVMHICILLSWLPYFLCLEVNSMCPIWGRKLLIFSNLRTLMRNPKEECFSISDSRCTRTAMQSQCRLSCIILLESHITRYYICAETQRNQKIMSKQK